MSIDFDGPLTLPEMLAELVSAGEVTDLAAQRIEREFFSQRATIERLTAELEAARREVKRVDWDAALKEFHETLGQQEESTPGFGSREMVGLRAALLYEEFNEALTAISMRDLVETADGLIDLIVVAIGTLRCFGLPAHALFAEVHRSNMAKVGGQRRADGKFLKPKGWTPPDIAGVLDAARAAGGEDGKNP